MTTPVSLTVPQFTANPGPLAELAGWAPTAGIAGLFAFDHLVPIGDPKRPVLEGVATLGLLAAISPPALRVGSLVMRVSLRPPPVTAAVAQTLSAVALAPPVLGLGVGDRFSEEEGARFDLVPPGLDERLGLLEETIGLVRERAPAAEIWVGGIHPRVRRAALLADGWNGWSLEPDELTRLTEELRGESSGLKLTWGGGVLLASSQAELGEMLERRSAIAANQPISGTPPQIVEELSRRAQLVDELVVSVLPNRRATWDLFAGEVLPHLD
ncbi:MAG TPA: hypothetical protein VJR05_07740 [Acidimicrobiia bacterium]|nr:hypothetical protein [Acidimicrobiia bacterium]